MTVLFRKLLLAVRFKRCPCNFLPNPLSRRVIITLFLYGLEFFHVSKTLALNPWPCVQCCWVLYLYTSLSTKHVCCFLLYASVEYPKSFTSVGPFLSNCLVGVASSCLQGYLIGQLYTWTLLSSLQFLLSSPEKVGRWTPFNLTGNVLCKDCFLPSFRPFKASLCRRTMT